jgi:hypothetical protein
MAKASVVSVAVLALTLGLAWTGPAVAQVYKSPPATETTLPAEKPPAVGIPRRRPAAGEEIKPPPDPAFTEQCAWIGKRIVSLLVRDDAMAANDFIPFYARFGCPEEHLSRAFGCLVANLMTVENSALADQAEECWRNPAVRYVPANNGNPQSPIEPSRPKEVKPTASPRGN